MYPPITLTAPPSPLQSTEISDNPVRLLFLILFRVCTFFCMLLWWWPNAPSNSLVVVQKLETKKYPPDFDTAPSSLLQSEEFLDNLVLLLFPMLFRIRMTSVCCCDGGRTLPNTATHPQPKKYPPDFAYSSTISSPITRILR
jgi:hypothetical protein